MAHWIFLFDFFIVIAIGFRYIFSNGEKILNFKRSNLNKGGITWRSSSDDLQTPIKVAFIAENYIYKKNRLPGDNPV